MSIRKWIGGKWKLLKHSKFFLFVLGLVIGATYFYCYIAGTEYLNYAVIGYKYSTEFLNRAEASVTRQDMGASVQADSHLDKVTPEALIKKYFQENYETALAIAKCESSLRSDNIGDGHLSKPSVGLFQISQIYHDYTTEQLQDAEFNVKVAREIYGKHGWKSWTCFRSGGYLKYL